jgi:tetratricopeptide (TPR) repeat protein
MIEATDPARRLMSLMRKTAAQAGRLGRRISPLRLGGLLVFVSCVHLAMTSSLSAQEARYELAEVPLLPPYCKHALDFRARVPGANDAAEIKRWYSALGPTFEHIHHYCYGLVLTNRARFSAKDNRDRLRHLRLSIPEFDYVLRNAPADFVLLPEVLTKKGENLLGLGRGPEGVGELLKAVHVKPDYWPPYALMSDYYKQLGNLPEARKILEQGLEANPGAEPLRKRLNRLR